MKVLLINPPREIPQIADYPPIGLLYIGAMADRKGHEVRIIDAASWDWDKLETTVRNESPEVVGITCWTIERGQAFKTAHVCKQAAPRAKIVFGGPHATAFPEHMFIKAPADYVVLGEGEETFGELVDALSLSAPVDQIAGLAYMGNDGLIKTAVRPLIKDLDTLPLPLHEQIDYSRYNGNYDTPRKSAAIITSRGCPFQCIYCSSTAYWGNKLRKRSVESVMTEIEKLYFEYGIRALLLFDDNLTIDRKRCIALSKALIDRNLDLIWAAEGSVGVDEETLTWMHRAGCYRIDFGVESGSPQILKNINKAYKIEDAKRAFQLCKKIGIRPNAYLILGSPGETKKTVDETISLMAQIQPDVSTPRAGLWILPNTRLYDLSVQQGVISERSWLQSDETFIYTGEHSQQRLAAFRRQFASGMALRRGGVKSYLSEFAGQAFEIITVSRLGSWLKYIVRHLRHFRGIN